MQAWSLLLLFLILACGRELEPLNRASEQVQLASENEIASGRVVPHSYIVAFRNLLDQDGLLTAAYPQVRLAHMRSLAQPWAHASSFQNVRYMSMLNLNVLGRSFKPLRSIDPAPWMQFGPHTDKRFASLLSLTFHTEAEARGNLEQWQREGRIWFAEPDYKSHIEGELEDKLQRNFDGNTGTPWLDQIKFASAIGEMNSLSKIYSPVIAVMDSGVDVQHEDLQDAIFRNENGQNKFCNGDFFGCNTTVSKKETLGDGNVYPTGTSGYSQACSSATEQGQCEHGTHVAGIIAARNVDTYTGVCPYCKILVVKVVEVDAQSGRLSISDSAILAGLSYISGFKVGGEPQVRIINASFGKYESSRSVELFVSALRQTGLGTLMIAAAGNEDTIRRTYPAGFEDVIAVANIESSPQIPLKSKGSNFGMWVDIAAPGDGRCTLGGGPGIFSSLPGGLVGCKVGTSMAAPIVSGVAGLMLAKDPKLSADEIARRLKATADPSNLYREDLNGAYLPLVGDKLVPLLGSGIVNASAALQADKDTTPSLASGRSNQVQPGCGLLGAGTSNRQGWNVLWLLLPLFFSAKIFDKRVGPRSALQQPVTTHKAFRRG